MLFHNKISANLVFYTFLIEKIIYGNIYGISLRNINSVILNLYKNVKINILQQKYGKIINSYLRFFI